MPAPSTIDISEPTASVAATAPAAEAAKPSLLICAPALAPDVRQHMLFALEQAFPGESILLASGDPAPPDHPTVRFIPYGDSHGQPGWILTAGAYLAAGNLTREHQPQAVLLLGPDAGSIEPTRLREMVDAVRNKRADLVVPRLEVGPSQGLVAAALLYPLTRALYAADIHFPLPADAALSARMAQRLATAAQRQAANNQPDALLWPVPEAAAASFAAREVAPLNEVLPQPPETDFNALFAMVAGSLFADIEAKASFWQRARGISAAAATISAAQTDPVEPTAEVVSMVENFRLAYANLHEIWSLILPPQTLLALKRLSLAQPDAFLVSANLWARIVYDFALAFRLRTINRGHLLGAFTPLYLAWVASHMRLADDDQSRAQAHIAQTAAAFETEKPYLVSRWRWPDRFNP